ncbi:MAG TPA: hypothetical protein VFO16_10385 [Pseudonocardiaceae bacterium]|nr:hypothetical protein [Pseudonocardiaceae bacterium]
MTGETLNKKLSAALRAQASGLGSGQTEAPGTRSSPAAGPSRRRSSPATHRLPAWVVLALAAALGAMAGGLAGAVSTW